MSGWNRMRVWHAAMWRWLARHPGKCKCDWPGWLARTFPTEAGKVIRDVWSSTECFACYIVEGDCRRCPVRPTARRCELDGSLFARIENMLERPEAGRWAAACLKMAGAWAPGETE